MRSRQTLWLGGIGALLLLGAGFYWWTGGDVTAWWCLGSLAQATDATRAERAERVADLNDRALPGLLGLLQREDAATCQNARAGLTCLLRRWGPDDPRLPQTIQTLSRNFAGLSSAGKIAVLGIPSEAQPAGAEEAPPAVRAAWSAILIEVRPDAPEEVRGSSLDLASWLLSSASTRPEVLPVSRELVRSCLTAHDPALRCRAVKLALIPNMEVYDEVVTLLRDPVVEVRRYAIVVVGPADKAVLDESLLPCLRDPDPEVVRICEGALRGRGLTSQHLKLCRLLIDPAPLERLKVLDLLRYAPELEPGVWLRRLSHDPADSVRAAAVRMMAEQTTVDLVDRLEQMQTSDPSPTVCELAAYYLRQTRLKMD
jgi:hypothetical protein